MKKRLSFSQLTALSLALLPAQQITTSTLASPKSPTSPVAEVTVPIITASTQQPTGWSFTGMLFGSSAQATSKQLTPQEQLHADLLKAAQDGTLLSGDKIHPKFTKDVDTAVLAGYLSSALTKATDARLTATRKTTEKFDAERKAFLEQDSKEAATIAQILTALQVTNHISVRQVKDVQGKCKDGRNCFNELVSSTIEAGYAFSTKSQEERARMDEALMAGGGTKAFTGQTSPRQKQVEYLASFKKVEPKKQEPKKDPSAKAE